MFTQVQHLLPYHQFVFPPGLLVPKLLRLFPSVTESIPKTYDLNLRRVEGEGGQAGKRARPTAGPKARLMGGFYLNLNEI